MSRYIKIIVFGLLLVTIIVGLAACRSSKSDRAKVETTEQTKQKNDIAASQEKELLAEIINIVEKAMSDDTNITKTEIEYDSDKPINPDTGKPPIKKETAINLNRKTEDKSIIKYNTSLTEKEKNDIKNNSQIEAEIRHKSNTVSDTNIQNESDIFLKWVGGISLFLVISSLIVYVIYRRLKKL